MCFIGSELILSLISNDFNFKSVSILKILSFGIPFLPFGAYFTYLLVIQDRSKYLLISVVLISFLNLILIYPSIHYFGIFGIAFLTVFISCLVAIIKGYFTFSSK